MPVLIWVVVLVKVEVTGRVVVTKTVVDASAGRLQDWGISDSYSPWKFELWNI